MAQHSRCTCPVHDQPPPLSGRRSVGVMIRSPQKHMKDQAVQTSFESDINYYPRTRIGMDRSQPDRAESILLEIEISDNNIQVDYKTPNDKQDFAMNTEEEVILEISPSQELNERHASVKLTPRNDTISGTRKGHNDETEKSEANLLEREFIRDYLPEVYGTFDDQCELVIEFEVDEVPFDFAESTKLSDSSRYSSVELENEIDSGLHSEASTVETKIIRVELPIIYEIPHYQSEAIIKDGGKLSMKAESPKLIKINNYMDYLPHRDLVFSAQNGLASSQVDRSEIRKLQHELNHYELPKVYDQCYLITKVGIEDISFKQVNLLYFKGLPYCVNSLSQEDHVLETKVRHCGSPVETDDSSLLEKGTSRVEIPRGYTINQRYSDTDIRTEDEALIGPIRPPKLNEGFHHFIYISQKYDSQEPQSDLDVVRVQSGEAKLSEMEYPSNEVAGVPAPTYQSYIEKTEDKSELLYIELREMEELNDFPSSVNLVPQTDSSTRPIDLNLILDNGKCHSTETSSRKDNGSVECIDCSSQTDGEATTIARPSVMEAEINYERDVTSYNIIVDTMQVNSEKKRENMYTNYQIKTDSNLNKIKLHFKHINNEALDKIRHPNDLTHSYHITEKKFPAHKELAQTSNRNLSDQFTDKGSKKVPINIRKSEAVPFSQETWPPSVQLKQNSKTTVNQTSRNVFPSFIVAKTPPVPSPHISSVKEAHSNNRHISYADVPSHGGVFMVGKENVAIFSQSRVPASRPARPPVRRGELSWESDSPVSTANHAVCVGIRTPIAPTITSSQCYQSRYSSNIRTVRKSQTNVLPSKTCTFLSNNERSVHMDTLSYSSHYEQSQNTTVDDSILEKPTSSRRQETTHPAIVHPPGALTRVPHQFSAPTSVSRLTLGFRHDFHAPCRCCCHCQHFHSRGPCSSGTHCDCLMHEHYPHHYMTEHIVRNFFTWPAMVTFFAWKINNFQCNNFKFLKSFNFSFGGILGKLASPLKIADVDESCHCKDECHFISSTKDSHVCNCKECAKRTHEKSFQVDKAIQVPPVENTAVQTDLEVRDVPVTEWVSEAGHLYPSLTVSAEDQSVLHVTSPAGDDSAPRAMCQLPPAGDDSAPRAMCQLPPAGDDSAPRAMCQLPPAGDDSAPRAMCQLPPAGDDSAPRAQCQLQVFLPVQECVSAPRTVHVQDFKIALLPSSGVTERHAIHDEHLRTREHIEVRKHQRRQHNWHVWKFYIIAAVVLATVLLCLTIFLYPSGETSSSQVVADRLFRAIICSACALVIVLAFYVVWAGFHLDECRAHIIVAGVSAIGLVVFVVLGVLALLDSAAPVFAVLIFLLAAIFLVACAHSAIVLSRNWPCDSPPLPTSRP